MEAAAEELEEQTMLEEEEEEGEALELRVQKHSSMVCVLSAEEVASFQ